MVPEGLAGVNVGNMNLHRRGRYGTQCIGQRNGSMGKRSRIDNDTVHLETEFVNFI